MLTVLFALTAPATADPNQPYLPTKPAGITPIAAQFMPALVSRLDDTTPVVDSNTMETNYQRWCDFDNNWSREGPTAAKLPTRARQIPPPARYLPRAVASHSTKLSQSVPILGTTSASVSWYDGMCKPRGQRSRFLAWHVAYADYAAWDGQLVLCDTLWYEIVKHSTKSSPFFIVKVDGTPLLHIQARTVEEMEGKLVDRFAAFVEAATKCIPPPKYFGTLGLNRGDGYSSEARFR
jgi:hypothetical protein